MIAAGIGEDAAAMGVTEAEVLVCCGGGGLTSGIALALEADAPGMRVRPVEPEGFDDVTRSLRSGQRESNTRTSGNICDAILTPQPGEITFPILQRLVGPGIAVSEYDCLRAMAQAFLRLKLVAEPGGAAALAAALFHASEVDSDTVICTISGGNVDAPVFARALDTLQ
jgi:threonine dehydratase